MGGGSSSNTGTSQTTSVTTSSVDSSHTNNNQFGNQNVGIGGSTGAGTSIAFSNLAALLGADSRTYTPLNLAQPTLSGTRQVVLLLI